MKSAEEVLNDFPLLKSYKGYSALVACLEMAREDEGRLVHIRKHIYTPIAQARGETVHNLEKNLRTVRDAFLAYGGKAYLERNLRVKIHLPLYPREMIEMLLECMRRGQERRPPV
ncbi:MAG: hypothetical protein HFG42_04150 [Lachnospiraceae bacterium]|jgi:hypothetical protein|nr:hypothetical protein [Lachnospiraceae bacterium]